MKKLFLIFLCLILVTTVYAGGIVEKYSTDGLHGVNGMLNDLYSLEKNTLFTEEEKEEGINLILSGVSLKTIIRDHNARIEAERLVTPFFSTLFSYRGFESNVTIAPTYATFSINEKASVETVESLMENLKNLYSGVEGVTLTLEDGFVRFAYDEYDEDILLSAYRVLEKDLKDYIDDYYLRESEKEAALAAMKAEIDDAFNDVEIDEVESDILDDEVYITEISANGVSGYIEARKDKTTITFTEGFGRIDEKMLISYIQKNGTTLFKTYSLEGSTYTFVYDTEDMITVEREVDLFKLLVAEYLNAADEKKGTSPFSFDFSLDFGVRSYLNFTEKKYSFYPKMDVDLKLSLYCVFARASVEGYAMKESEKLYFIGAVRADGGLGYKFGIFEPYLFAGGRYVFSNASDITNGFVVEYGGGAVFHLSDNIFIDVEAQRYNKTMYYLASFGYKF